MMSYLDQMGVISPKDAPRINFLSSESKSSMVGKFSNGMKFFIFSLFYRKKMKFLPTFYSFDLFLTIFGLFGLIWCCRGPF